MNTITAVNNHEAGSRFKTFNGYLIFLAGSLLTLNLLLRLVLAWDNRSSELGPGTGFAVLSRGFLTDVFIALGVLIGLLFMSLVLPRRLLVSKIWLLLWVPGSLIVSGIALFQSVAERYFFEEFKSRFNTVSVDYLLYPHEVFINIWDTYPVAKVILVCSIGALIWTILSTVLFHSIWKSSMLPKRRYVLFRIVLLMAGMVLMWPFVGSRRAMVSSDRVVNEIAKNGTYSFMEAAITRELDYVPFYRTMPLDESYQEVRKLVATPTSSFLEQSNSLRRSIPGDLSKPRHNVVLFLEESLGSEFFGSLGRVEETLTPELDKLAETKGLLFTHIYASGNRTVRGMEGILCSFPPLPGDSVVVRPRNDKIETLARVLARDGYSTTFMYGGRGLFDNLRPFMTDNGYQRFIEQNDYKNPVFSTIWGVSNEDLYQRGLEECRELNQAGKPFFVTMLSVSNHKPFTYPKGRIKEDPAERKRENAVKYNDYALGKFFAEVQKESYWTNTIFIVVADHGARVYGKETIPMKSYEIPFLILGPAVVTQPSRNEILGGQLDVGPTILGLLGRPYSSTFFGRDLLQKDRGESWVILHHNRDIGLYRNQRMAILGLNRQRSFFYGDPRTSEPTHVLEPDEEALRSERDATAIFGVANDLYLQETFNFPETLSRPVSLDK